MLTRRAITTGLATAPFAGTAAAASTPDPVFAAIEAHRAAHARCMAFYASDHDDDIPDDLCDAETDRMAELLAMTPSTRAGCTAMMRYIETFLRGEDEDDTALFGDWFERFSDPGKTLLSRLAAVLEQG